MTVLKSAASAAVYGSDAVNGVIVVTTKRGKSNQAPTINFNTSYQAAGLLTSRNYSTSLDKDRAMPDT